jgi:shikimate 5-dehydrogenase
MNRTAGAESGWPSRRGQVHRALLLKKLAFDVIINATPVGMKEAQALPLKDREINARVVMDMGQPGRDALPAPREPAIQVIPGWEMLPFRGAPVRDLDWQAGPVDECNASCWRRWSSGGRGGARRRSRSAHPIT